jgi:hypothetical protein
MLDTRGSNLLSGPRNRGSLNLDAAAPDRSPDVSMGSIGARSHSEAVGNGLNRSAPGLEMKR